MVLRTDMRHTSLCRLNEARRLNMLPLFRKRPPCQHHEKALCIGCISILRNGSKTTLDGDIIKCTAPLILTNSQLFINLTQSDRPIICRYISAPARTPAVVSNRATGGSTNSAITHLYASSQILLRSCQLSPDASRCSDSSSTPVYNLLCLSVAMRRLPFDTNSTLLRFEQVQFPLQYATNIVYELNLAL